MLQIKNVTVEFDLGKAGKLVALKNNSLEVSEQEFSVIVGPSGCGKSTLLRLVAGLQKQTSGEALLDGKSITGPSAERGMVFQSYTLYPWLTVLKNVEFGLNLKGLSKSVATEIAMDFLIQVGLEDFSHSYPDQLSGGMRQRVALARALANDPKILLMDEPFGALDSQTRGLMQELLLEIWEKSHKTVLFITHDIEEAIFLADMVHVMSARPGRIKEKIEITIPRPRTVDVLTSLEFVAIKKQVLELMHDEAVIAIQQSFG